PAMDLQVHLNTLYLRDFVCALQGLFGICETASITCAAPYNCFVRLTTVINRDAFGRQHSRCMARCLMELDRLATEAQRVAFLHDHVLLRDAGRRCTASTRTAARLLDHLPVFFDGDDTRTGRFLNPRCTTEMIEMSVVQEDVFDALRIDTDFPDVTDDVVDIGFLGRVEENAAFRRC